MSPSPGRKVALIARRHSRARSGGNESGSTGRSPDITRSATQKAPPSSSFPPVCVLLVIEYTNTPPTKTLCGVNASARGCAIPTSGTQQPPAQVSRNISKEIVGACERRLPGEVAYKIILRSASQSRALSLSLSLRIGSKLIPRNSTPLSVMFSLYFLGCGVFGILSLSDSLSLSLSLSTLFVLLPSSLLTSR